MRASTGRTRPHTLTVRRLAALLSCLTAILVVGCTGSMKVDSGPSSPPPAPRPAAVAQLPAQDTTIVPSKDATSLALAASQKLFSSATVVILAPANDHPALARAASIAIAIGVPVLPTGVDDRAIGEEFLRLSTTTVIPVGGVTMDVFDLTSMSVQPAGDDSAVAELLGVEVTTAQGKPTVGRLANLQPGHLLPGPKATAEEDGHMPEIMEAKRLTGVQVLADGNTAQLAAVGTARAAGATVTIVSGDPRASARKFKDTHPPQAVLGFGDTFGDPKSFAWQARTAMTGTELPAGGQLVFDDARYVGLYGSPHSSALGALGEQGKSATIKRAAKVARSYQKFTQDQVVPTLEIIVTVADGSAGADGNYSREWPAEGFEPLIKAAQQAGQYVVLDFQPGRSNFLEQVKQYKRLLKYPHVGVALDPEWRLGPKQLPLQQIGTVSAVEVNDVITYLADLVRAQRLPQKVLIIHQFRTDMLTERRVLDLDRAELAVTIHVDGFGSPGAKKQTWNAVRADAPRALHWGWKVFYDEDKPRMSAKDVYAIEPETEFVSYQ